MLKAVGAGRIDYSTFAFDDSISYIREQLLLEDFEQSVYTDMWRTLTIAHGGQEESQRFIKKLTPWENAQQTRSGHSRKKKIRDEQYKNKDFCKEVDRLLNEGIDRDTAEDLAEFHVLKKLGLL